MKTEAHLREGLQGTCGLLGAYGAKRFEIMKKAHSTGIKNRAGHVWSFPDKGYLFPLCKTAKKPYINKDVVSHVIAEVREILPEEEPTLLTSGLRIF